MLYIEDNHAGSFFWIARNLDLEESCTLVLFDAHSDATAIFDSDTLRTQLRSIYPPAEWADRLQRWRRDGTIQCFGWIEPLMPSPFSRVLWVPREKISPADAAKLTAEAGEYLDAHIEAAPRRDGSFAGRYRACSLAALPGLLTPGGPVIVTIDLDYFSGMPEPETAFERVWQFVVACRNLRAVTFAISRPFLKEDAEAERLLGLAIHASLSLPTANIFFEPFATVGNDRSKRAVQLQQDKMAVPFYDIRAAAPDLRALLLANRDRIIVKEGAASWDTLLGQWEARGPRARLAIRDHTPSTDGIWRVAASERPEVILRMDPADATPDLVEWFVESPMFPSCNLVASRDDEPGFASGAPPRPRWKEVPLEASGPTLDFAAMRSYLDSGTGCGDVRLKARVRSGDHLLETGVMEVRFYAWNGFRAALSEQLGLPYLFGSGRLDNGHETGPETGWGADCANFVVYALRRQGLRVPWSNPKQLRGFLETVAAPAVIGQTPIGGEDVERGLVIHFGNHVAVLMEDRPPLGILDEGDLVAHHLEGFPAIVPLGTLSGSRKPPDLLRVPSKCAGSTVLVGGDVMLSRSIGQRISEGIDPFADIHDLLENSAARVINLECVVSEKGIPDGRKRYTFRAPVESAERLHSAGIDVAGLANNHALDFGRKALLDCVARLQKEKILTPGAGDSQAAALEPAILKLPHELKVAILAIDALDHRPPTAGTSVATSRARELIALAIQKARARATTVICLVHWGEENSGSVTEEQRQLARWLIDQGVDVIAGSHPHVLQPLDTYRGRPIAFSLGNLVFDGGSTLDQWNHGTLLEIQIPDTGNFPRTRLIPIALDSGGFPHPETQN